MQAGLHRAIDFFSDRRAALRPPACPKAAQRAETAFEKRRYGLRTQEEIP